MDFFWFSYFLRTKNLSHFAKVENGLVTQVIVAEQDVIDSGIFGHGWVQTSYNTHGGVHANGNQLTQVELISIDTEVQFMPFATGSPSPGVGTGSVGPITHVANDTIIKSITANTNIVPNTNIPNLIGIVVLAIIIVFMLGNFY